MPAENRATSGYLVCGGCVSVLFDCGYLVADRLEKYCDPRKLSAVIISHMHPDHYDGLFALDQMLFEKQAQPIPVFLPPDGIRVLQQIQEDDLHRESIGRAIKVQEYDPSMGLCIDTLRINFTLTRHSTSSYAMRVSEKGNTKCLVYTSDTGWFDELVSVCRGAELVLVEAGEYPTAGNDREAERWHLTPEEAGRLIGEANVAKGIITHCEAKYSKEILSIASRMCGRGNVVLAAECAEFVI